MSIYKVNKCIDDIIERNDLYVDDTPVMHEKELMYKSERISFNPAIIINNITYRDDFEIDLLLDAICAAYIAEYLTDFYKKIKKLI